MCAVRGCGIPGTLREPSSGLWSAYRKNWILSSHFPPYYYNLPNVGRFFICTTAISNTWKGFYIFFLFKATHVFTYSQNNLRSAALKLLLLLWEWRDGARVAARSTARLSARCSTRWWFRGTCCRQMAGAARARTPWCEERPHLQTSAVAPQVSFKVNQITNVLSKDTFLSGKHLGSHCKFKSHSSRLFTVMPC